MTARRPATSPSAASSCVAGPGTGSAGRAGRAGPVPGTGSARPRGKAVALGGALVALGAAVGVGLVSRAGWRIYQSIGTPRARVGFRLAPAELAAARDLLARSPVIDTHAHPGRTFVGDAGELTWRLRLYARRRPFEPRSVAAMRTGGVTAACFCAVADFPTLDATGHGLAQVRDFDRGEALAYYRAQIGNLHMALRRSGAVLVRDTAGLAAARTAGQVAGILGVEGADFLEGDLARVGAAYEDGVRVLTLVHYRAGGGIGDVMTSPPVHGGLTPFGRDVVTEMGRLGMLVDLAHASEATAYDALEAARGPVLLTHTDVAGEGEHPRFVSLGLARAVALGGGLVGAWPAGIAAHSLAGFIRRVERLVELLGEDHVCLGTDMDANYRPVLESYAKMPLLVGGLLHGGMSETAVAKVVGGNFLRVWGEVEAARGR